MPEFLQNSTTETGQCARVKTGFQIPQVPIPDANPWLCQVGLAIRLRALSQQTLPLIRYGRATSFYDKAVMLNQPSNGLRPSLARMKPFVQNARSSPKTEKRYLLILECPPPATGLSNTWIRSRLRAIYPYSFSLGATAITLLCQLKRPRRSFVTCSK